MDLAPRGLAFLPVALGPKVGGCEKVQGYEKVSDELVECLICHWMCQRAVALGLQLLWVVFRGAALLLVALDVKVFELCDELVCHWAC